MKPISASELSFPVLAFKSRTVGGFRSLNELTTCTRAALKEGGFYENLLLVDCEGQVCVVDSVEEVSLPYFQRPKTPFGRGIKVTIVSLLRVNRVSVEDYKAYLLLKLCQLERPFDEEARARIARATTHEEVYRFLYDLPG